MTKIVLCALLILVIGKTQAQVCKPCEETDTEYKVYGRVVDQNDNGLGNVRVTLKRGDSKKQCLSDEQDDYRGSYELCFSKGEETIDSIKFVLVDWGPNSIVNLSGQRGNHNVHVVLYPEGTERPLAVGLQELTTLELLWIEALEEGGSEEQYRLKMRYQNFLVNFKVSSSRSENPSTRKDVRELVDRRLNYIKSLYGVE